jgi:hypothetical protein
MPSSNFRYDQMDKCERYDFGHISKGASEKLLPFIMCL